MANWYYRQEGQEVGPADEEMLAALIDLGHLTGDSQVRRSDHRLWIRASRSPLAPLLRAKEDAAAAGQAARPDSLALPGRPAQPPSTRVLVFFRSALVALLILGVIFALLYSLVAVKLFLSAGSTAFEAEGHVNLDLETLPLLVGYLVGAIAPALVFVVALVLAVTEIAAVGLSVFVMYFYMHWIYKAAAELYHCSGPARATRPSYVLLWHLLPPANLFYPPRLMLRLYRWAEEQGGTKEVGWPSALVLWWIAMVLIFFGVVAECLFLADPTLRELAILDAGEGRSASAFTLRHVALIVFVAVLWLLPLALASFLWLERRISRALFTVAERQTASPADAEGSVG